MNKEFIPYEQALELKKLSFNEPCFARYIKSQLSLYQVDTQHDFKETALAPVYQQAFRWFREKHGYFPDFFVDDDKTFGFSISYFTYTERVDRPIERKFNTYEESELACLKKLIEIVKAE